MIKKHRLAIESNTLSDLELKKRQDALDRDWLHLQNQRAALVAHAKQDDLSEYRATNKTKKLSELKSEPHHPTKRLSNYLIQNGEPKPSEVHEAHHIVMGKGRFLKAEMQLVRTTLHLYGVGINDPKNGVWLPNYLKNSDDWRLPESPAEKPRHWATPNSPTHRPLHGKNYEKWVTTSLNSLKGSEVSFMGGLGNLKRKLIDGTFPEKILEKSDPQWSGKA